MLRDELIPITQEHEYLRIAFMATFFAGVTQVTFRIFSGYWRWLCMLGDGNFGDYGKWFVLLYGSLLVCCGLEAAVFKHKLVKANGIVVEKWLKTKA
ncbi:hypothetical protein HanRHA438_Chr07g0291861 [Helianthus annuus]|nr:hypothetical protein HanIR_Chr07g0303031 [Helianthus annuus]KAJ0906845.1 hypothetical protein HanRHA438_Chr07g0291861 [Helianthus annuus]